MPNSPAASSHNVPDANAGMMSNEVCQNTFNSPLTLDEIMNLFNQNDNGEIEKAMKSIPLADAMKQQINDQAVYIFDDTLDTVWDAPSNLHQELFSAIFILQQHISYYYLDSLFHDNTIALELDDKIELICSVQLINDCFHNHPVIYEDEPNTCLNGIFDPILGAHTTSSPSFISYVQLTLLNRIKIESIKRESSIIISPIFNCFMAGDTHSLTENDDWRDELSYKATEQALKNYGKLDDFTSMFAMCCHSLKTMALALINLIEQGELNPETLKLEQNTKNDWTPFMLAAGSHPEVAFAMLRLIEQGTLNPETLRLDQVTKTNGEWTVFMMAARGRPEIALALLKLILQEKLHPERLNLQHVSKDSWTTFILAARNHPEVALALIDLVEQEKLHPELLNLQQITDEGCTAFMIAAKFHPQVAFALINLLDQGKISPETLNLQQVSNQGWTTFMFAARNHPEVALALINLADQGKLSLETLKLQHISNQGWTAFMIVARNHPEMALALIKLVEQGKLSLDTLNLHHVSNQGWTAFMLALIFSNNVDFTLKIWELADKNLDLAMGSHYNSVLDLGGVHPSLYFCIGNYSNEFDAQKKLWLIMIEELYRDYKKIAQTLSVSSTKALSERIQFFNTLLSVILNLNSKETFEHLSLILNVDYVKKLWKYQDDFIICCTKLLEKQFLQQPLSLLDNEAGSSTDNKHDEEAEGRLKQVKRKNNDGNSERKRQRQTSSQASSAFFSDDVKTGSSCSSSNAPSVRF